MDAALDVLIEEHGHSPEAIMGADGLLAQMTKALVERVLGAELTHYLRTGCSETPEGSEGVEKAANNCRNGFSK